MRVIDSRAAPFRVFGLILVACMANPGRAQDRPRGDVQSQLDELRRRNEDLAARVAELEVREAEVDEGSDAGGLMARYGEVTATFKVFADVGFTYDNPAPAGQTQASFFTGSVDLFANVQLGDRFRVLSESVIEQRGSSSAITVDQERLWAMWTVDDWLYFKLGTEHSPVSRWNQLYHHGHWLEIPITRPYLALFEGDGGILAMHATGLELGGRLQSELGGIDWFATVSNGRGLEANDKQRSFDRNHDKKLDAGAAFQPAAVPDLRVGVAVTTDEIPANPASTVPGRTRSIREFVAAVNLQYRFGAVDLLGEFAWIGHDAHATGTSTHHHTGYLQAAWRAGALTPFTRFDYRNMQMGDAFYLGLDRDLDAVRQVVGVRYDASDNVAAKLELGFSRADERSGGSVRQVDTAAAAVQVSWVF